MPTQTGIVNDALELIGAQTVISALNDGTPAGNAAGAIYTPAVQLLLREIDPDFARKPASLVAQTSATLIALTSWSQEYAYPADCLRLRQLRPAPANYNVLDPQPIRGEVGFDPLSAGGPAKVVLCNLASAIAVYTTSNVTEAQFDWAFTEALKRRIANPLAMALAGRPDFARELLDEAERYAGMAELADEF